MTVHEDDAARRAAAQYAVAEHLRLTAAGHTEEWVKLFAPDAVLEFPYAPARRAPAGNGARRTARAHEQFSRDL